MDIFSTFAGGIPMTMELELYRTALILAGAVNLLIAVALLHNNIYFRIYDIWPYSLLTLSGVVVFSFIFYSLVEYGNVIDAATNATEDASKGKKVKMVR